MGNTRSDESKNTRLAVKPIIRGHGSRVLEREGRCADFICTVKKDPTARSPPLLMTQSFTLAALLLHVLICETQGSLRFCDAGVILVARALAK